MAKTKLSNSKHETSLVAVGNTETLNACGELIRRQAASAAGAMLVEARTPRLKAWEFQLYDHSGITMNTEGFSDHWDSGQVRFIYIPVSKALAEFGSGSAELDDEIREKVLEALKAEVKTYDSYLRGDVFRFELQNPEGDQIESCSGFYSVEDAEQAAAGMVPSSEQ